jgi:hypothetical protein
LEKLFFNVLLGSGFAWIRISHFQSWTRIRMKSMRMRNTSKINALGHCPVHCSVGQTVLLITGSVVSGSSAGGRVASSYHRTSKIIFVFTFSMLYGTVRLERLFTLQSVRLYRSVFLKRARLSKALKNC